MSPIATTKIYGRALIDSLLLHKVAAEENIKRLLATEVVHEGEKWGYFIRPESVWYTFGEELQNTFQIEITAIWCPDPTQGCEFVGGEYDGDTMPVQRESWGGPNRYLVRLTQVRQDMYVRPELEKLPQPMRHPSYRLAGINYETDRWVYEFEGLR